MALREVVLGVAPDPAASSSSGGDLLLFDVRDGVYIGWFTGETDSPPREVRVLREGDVIPFGFGVVGSDDRTLPDGSREIYYAFQKLESK